MTSMADRYEDCKKKFLSRADYYKLMLRAVLMSLGVITIIVLAVVGYSYQPIKDISAMKVEVIHMHEKIDKIVKKVDAKDSKEQISAQAEIPDTDKIALKLPMMINNPALGAVCSHD